ncbi:MAG: FMNH2-dependent monooxygenase [Pseudonocardiales bacterium]|nr:FMNH2-dependent monooxygenase [Pseudonocardiales bacterium]
MSERMFHMGWFLGTGFGTYGWNQRWSGNSGKDVAKPGLFIDMARSLERAGFDYMMLEDSSQIPEVYKGSREFALSRGTLRQDPMPLVPILARATEHLGIIATMSTSFYPPYLAARLLTTQDHLTGGRVGVNLVTSSPDAAAQNYGMDKHWPHDQRYEIADEWVECVKALWNSWDDGATVADSEAGVYVDYTKVHPIHFEGEYFRSRGPLNSPPGPQRQPVICQAGGSEAGRNFGAKHAETLIASLAEDPGVEKMKAYRDDVVGRMIGFGRNPSDAKMLFLAQPIMADTDEGAREKQRSIISAQAANTEQLLAGLSGYSGLDFSKFDLDAPLEEDLADRTNGHVSLVRDFVRNASGKTLREALADRANSIGSVELVGTPETVAVQMGEIMDEVGGDGFLIRAQVTRANITEVCDGLAPALRKRGLIRSHYEFDTFRENLLAF